MSDHVLHMSIESGYKTTFSVLTRNINPIIPSLNFYEFVKNGLDR